MESRETWKHYEEEYAVSLSFEQVFSTAFHVMFKEIKFHLFGS